MAKKEEGNIEYAKKWYLIGIQHGILSLFEKEKNFDRWFEELWKKEEM